MVVGDAADAALTAAAPPSVVGPVVVVIVLVTTFALPPLPCSSWSPTEGDALQLLSL